MLISLPIFVLGTDVVYTKIPTDQDTSAIGNYTESIASLKFHSYPVLKLKKF